MEINQDSYLADIFEPEIRHPFDNYYNGYSMLYRDAFIRKIIDKYPNDAYNLGYKIESDDNESYTDLLNEIKVYETFRKASKYARLYGLCAIFLMVEGDEKLNLPLGIVKPVGLKIFKLFNTQDIESELIKIGNTMVHRSRLMFFTGNEVFIDHGQEVKLGYTSIIDGFLEEYDNYKPMSKVLRKLINTSNQAILGTKGLSAKLRADILNGTDLAKKELLERAKALNTGRNIQDLIVHDLENEEMKNISLSISGVPESIDKLEHLLSIRLDYPHHVIFGDSVGSTLGSGSNAQLIYRMMYADRLTQWIDNNWTENIEKICELFKNFFNLSDFEVKIPLAYVLSDDERASINKTWADTLETILKYYPMDYDQIMEFINNNFSEMTIDELNFDPSFDIPSTINIPQVQNTLTTSKQDVNTDATMSSILEDAAKIDQTDIDQTMEDIAERSQNG